MCCVWIVIPFLASRGFASSDTISQRKKGPLSERHRANWSRVLRSNVTVGGNSLGSLIGGGGLQSSQWFTQS